MKNMNIKLAITIAFICPNLSMFSASVEVNWNSKPEYDGVLHTYSGKLADLYAAITGEGGQYQVFPAPDGGGSVTFDETDACCNLSGGDSKLPVLKVENIWVNFIFTGKYKMIEWSDRNDYGVRCESAGKEWDRYYSDTENHEAWHHKFDVGFVTNERAEEAVLNDFTDLSGKCVTTQAELDIEAQKLLSQLRSIASATAIKLVNNSKAADNTDIIYPYSTINATKDCPNIPLH